MNIHIAHDTKVFVTLREKKAMKYPFPVPSPNPNPNYNTKSKPLHDREMGTAIISCVECSQVAGLIQKVGRESSKSTVSSCSCPSCSCPSCSCLSFEDLAYA